MISPFHARLPFRNPIKPVCKKHGIANTITQSHQRTTRDIKSEIRISRETVGIKLSPIMCVIPLKAKNVSLSLVLTVTLEKKRIISQTPKHC